MNASPRLLVLALVCVMASAGRAQNIEQTQKGVVQIVATAADGNRRTGTGFVVRATRDTAQIVTASHVVEGARQIDVHFFTQRATPVAARVIALEGGDLQGLAALSVTSAVPSDISVFRMNRSARVNAGDPVTIVGFPQAGGPWAVTKGEIVGRRARAIVFTGVVDEGSSGAPLIREGEVIGVVVTEGRGQFAYAVPADIAQSILESWGVRFRTELRSTAATLTPGSVVQMIRDRGFHHPGDKRSQGLSASVTGNFEHEYESATYRGDAVVIDHATGLMWQRRGSEGVLDLATAQAYAGEQNSEEFAGFADWRLPTIEELAALIEPIGTDRGAFIDRAFSLSQIATYWSGDSIPSRSRWGVDFADGSVVVVTGLSHALVVRSLTGEEEAVAKGGRISRRPALPASLAESRIALTTAGPRGWTASVMNADGSGARTIFQSPQEIYDLAWSPGGTRVVFVHGEAVSRQVTVVSAGSTDQKHLIDRRPPTLGWGLSWSPDGRRIAIPCVPNDVFTICLIDVDAGKPPSPLRFVQSSDNGLNLSWSPDGTRLAYAREGGSGKIGIIDLRQMSVVSSGRSGKQPAWSPDGKRISFVADADGGSEEIFVMDADGSNLNRLTNHPATDRWPSWSPDGTKIVFVSERVSGWAIYMMDADGRNPTRITDPFEDETRPVWLSPAH